VLKLKTFHAANFSRPTRLRLLAACAIAPGRFCGVSAAFDEIGEALMPVDDEGRPRLGDWEIYAESCRDGLSLEIRDELWLAARFKDLEAVCSSNFAAGSKTNGSKSTAARRCSRKRGSAKFWPIKFCPGRNTLAAFITPPGAKPSPTPEASAISYRLLDSFSAGGQSGRLSQTALRKILPCS
jgi:hypothetical protein